MTTQLPAYDFLETSAAVTPAGARKAADPSKFATGGNRVPRENANSLRDEITQLRFAVRILKSYIEAVERRNISLRELSQTAYPTEVERCSQNAVSLAPSAHVA